MLSEQLTETIERVQSLENALNDILKDKKSENTWKEKLTNAVNDTSLHGVPRIFNSDHILVRLLWVIMIIIAMIGCGYLVANNVIDYYSYPVVTNTNSFYESAPLFPKVTLCDITVINSCQFNKENCGNSLTNLSDNCLEFNVGSDDSYRKVEKIKSKEAGPQSALRLILTSDPNNDAEILVYNHTSDLSKIIIISPGIIKHIKLKRLFQTKLSQPYSDCKADISYQNVEFTDIDIIDQKLFPYFQNDCFELCKIEKQFEICNKSEIFNINKRYYHTNYMYFIHEIIPEIKKCDRRILKKVHERFRIQGVYEVCKDECPAECNSNSYSMTISDSFKQLYLDQNKSEVFIYYEDFYYTLITEQAKISLDSSIGTIGGLVGLFLGASFLSTVEFLDLAINLLFLF